MQIKVRSIENGRFVVVLLIFSIGIAHHRCFCFPHIIGEMFNRSDQNDVAS
jgi:hypothetical protein